MSEAVVLVVDDEPQMTRMLARLLGKLEGVRVETCLSGEEALEKVHTIFPEVVLTDVKMPGMDGLELLARIRKVDPTISVILITGYGTIEMAVRAVKDGAYDFIEKPFDKDRLRHLVRRAVERTSLLRENERLQRRRVTNVWEELGIIGDSPVMKKLFELVERVAKSDVTVLIRGESGTGKELIARAIHRLSDRRHRDLITVNCPALPEHILESELFGYVKGAFTGANTDKMGLFQVANGSTIFLDEIGDIPLSIQTKLLRVLQEKEIRPLGSTKTVPVDVRVIASTNQDLEAKITEGAFREDLFYRLNVVTILVPPLRERGEDIILLARYFLQKYSEKYGRKGLEFSPEALEFLLEQPWKGNVRELENLIKRAVLLAPGERITPLDLRDHQETSPSAVPELLSSYLEKPYNQAKRELVSFFSRRYLENLLLKTGGNVTQAAKLAGLERQAFQRLMRQYGLRSKDFRQQESH
ncbi:MAG: sigma-54-dependent Fis family transcriptional regulator [Thermodesulfobacteria bacterium]|nr:sigma-54-dependent Fis family transcriptional regulator [Thermodesulfobacteriota bacterium]